MTIPQSPAFAACLNPATVSGLSFEDVAIAAATAGITHIEASIQQVVAYGPARAAALLNKIGVRVAAACGLLPDGPVLPYPLLVDEATYARALGGLGERLAAFTAIGCPVATTVINPWTDLEPPAVRELAITRLQALAGACADHGVTLAVEPVSVRCGLPSSLVGANAFVTDLPQLVRLLDDLTGMVPPTAVGLCVDSFHWAASGANSAHLTELGSWLIAHVQIADVPATPGADAWTDEMRLFPGDGALPWDTFTRALVAAGYRGPVSVELFNPRLRRLPVDEITRRTVAAVRTLNGER